MVWYWRPVYYGRQAFQTALGYFRGWTQATSAGLAPGGMVCGTATMVSRVDGTASVVARVDGTAGFQEC